MAAIRAAALQNPLCTKATHLWLCSQEDLEDDDECFALLRKAAGYARQATYHTYVADPSELPPGLLICNFILRDH